MTREKAIKNLKEQQKAFNEHCIDCTGVNEAYNMAIRSLEAYEKIKEDIDNWHNMNYSNLTNMQYETIIDIIDKHLRR